MSDRRFPLQPHIESRMLLRKQRVMLDADPATLYGVETRVLVQPVQRNLARFRWTSCSS